MLSLAAYMAMGLLIICSGSAAAATIQNAPVNFGMLSVPSSRSLGNTWSVPTFAIGDTVYDDYKFTIPNATVNAFDVTLDFANFLNISSFQGRIYKLTDPVPAGSPLPPGTISLQGSSQTIHAGNLTGTSIVIQPSTLTAGDYIFEIRGQVSGLAGGSYGGVLNVTAVPVPAAFYLLGSALVVVATIGRRLNDTSVRA